MNEGTKLRTVELQQHAEHFYRRARHLTEYVQHVQTQNTLGVYADVDTEKLVADAARHQHTARSYAAKARAILLDN